MKKLDWFSANRTLSVEVVDFMKCFVWKAEINEKFRREQAEIDTAIAGLEKLKGSILEDRIPEMRDTYLIRKQELDKQREDQIQTEATYTLSESDQKLKKALSAYAQGKKDAVMPEVAIQSWFLDHGLDVEDTAIVDEILNGAGENLKVKTLVKSDGKIVTAFNGTNCFKMVFAKCYEHMVDVGTIKATQIPPIMAEKYAPKKSKKAKKGE